MIARSSHYLNIARKTVFHTPGSVRTMIMESVRLITIFSVLVLVSAVPLRTFEAEFPNVTPTAPTSEPVHVNTASGTNMFAPGFTETLNQGFFLPSTVEQSLVTSRSAISPKPIGEILSSYAPMTMKRNRPHEASLPPMDTIVPESSEGPEVTAIPQPSSSQDPIPAHSIASETAMATLTISFPSLNEKQTQRMAAAKDPVASPEVEAESSMAPAESMASSIQMEISDRVVNLHEEYEKLARELAHNEKQKENNDHIPMRNSMFDHLGSAMDEISRRLKEEGLTVHGDD